MFTSVSSQSALVVASTEWHTLHTTCSRVCQHLIGWHSKGAGQHSDVYLGHPEFEGFEIIL